MQTVSSENKLQYEMKQKEEKVIKYTYPLRNN